MKPLTTKSGKIIIYDEHKLYVYGINRLSSREYSRKELRRKMQRLQPDHLIVDKVLDKLAAQNYLSDERRARNLLNQFKSREADKKIKYRMLQKGLDEETIANCFNVARLEDNYIDVKDEEVPETEKEEDKALGLVSRKFRVFNKENRPKMQRFLLSRGFNFEQINRVLKRFEIDQNENI